MPRLLIAGCGYLGREIASLLTTDGWEVEGWTMSTDSAGELSAAGHLASSVDISNEKAVAEGRSNFDAVILSASTGGGDVDSYRRVYLQGARNLRTTFPKARFIFIGSTSVYAQSGGEWVSEDSPAEPKHDTGKVLRESEIFVLANGATVIRLGGLYGPGRSVLLKRFLSGEATIDPSNDRYINQVHRDDAAVAIRLLLSAPGTAQQIYNVVDNQPGLLSECYRWLATRLNRPVPAREKAISKRKRGDSNKRVSNAKLRSAGWTPRYPTIADGMEKSVLPAYFDNAS